MFRTHTSYRTTTLAIATLLAAAPVAHAAIITRGALIRACASRSQTLLNNCAGYITGVSDTVNSDKDRVCLPPGLKVAPLRIGVANYLQTHGTSDGPAAPAVVDALRALYKCQ